MQVAADDVASKRPGQAAAPTVPDPRTIETSAMTAIMHSRDRLSTATDDIIVICLFGAVGLVLTAAALALGLGELGQVLVHLE
jgi:hypothetical protein